MEAKRIVHELRNGGGGGDEKRGGWRTWWCSWRSWFSSTAKSKDGTSAGKQESESSPAEPAAEKPSNTSEWTLVHGFYAAMGGIAIAPTPTSVAYLPEGAPRVVLTSSGLQFLHTHTPHLIPAITAADIGDKSKADSLKKFLVCAQALWFAVTTIARLGQGLPVSLLELNALAHAGCALLIYCFWWDKPLDVCEPTVVRGEGEELVDQVLAFSWMASRISSEVEGWKGLDMLGRVRDEFDALWLYEEPKVDDLVFARTDANAAAEGRQPVSLTTNISRPSASDSGGSRKTTERRGPSLKAESLVLDPVAYPR